MRRLVLVEDVQVELNVEPRGQGYNAGDCRCHRNGTSVMTKTKLSEYSLLRIDKATMAKLADYQKELSEYVGPMARVFVKEVVLALSRNGAFEGSQLPQALAMLADKIDLDKRAEFRARCSS